MGLSPYGHQCMTSVLVGRVFRGVGGVGTRPGCVLEGLWSDRRTEVTERVRVTHSSKVLPVTGPRLPTICKIYKRD